MGQVRDPRKVLSFRSMAWFRLTRTGHMEFDLSRGGWPAPEIVMRDWRILQRAVLYP